MEEKKNPKLDTRRYRGLFFNVGLVLSLGLVLMAFEWKTPGAISEVPPVFSDPFPEELYDTPLTVQPPPPKPKVEIFELIEKEDEEIIDEPEIDIDIFSDEKDVPEEPVFVESEPEERAPEFFTIVEQYPKFQGGDYSTFLKFVFEHLKYPPQARRMGIEGKVFVQFVVDDKGKVKDVEVVKGIGAGCDEEVLRVVKSSPDWEPGKQRGVPVNVRMIVPVKFSLNR